MRVLLTGATGFAGRHILRRLLDAGLSVRAPSRRPLPFHPLLETILIDDLLTTDWTTLSGDVNAVVHAAAYAHDDRADPQMIFRINRDATSALAQAAAQEGARFIFLSSIRAQAGVTARVPLQDDDIPQPDGPYGEAKLAAETAIARVCADHVNLRLAPLYGPGVKGNLATLFRLAAAGVPLPFGAIGAQRSLLSVHTLADLITHLLRDVPELRGTYLTAERGPLSIGDMISLLRAARGQPARLIPVPAGFIQMFCILIRRPLLWARLGEPLVVSDQIGLLRQFPDLFQSSAEGLSQWVNASHQN